jgi:hypothetical protein
MLSSGMFLRRTSCRSYAPELPFILSYVETGTRAHIGPIDFFHTKNHIGSESLTHGWKGEIKRSNLHYFLAQESSIKADF